MEFKARIFYDGRLVDPRDYPKLFICNKTVDRIVNDVYERVMKEMEEEDESDRKLPDDDDAYHQ